MNNQWTDERVETIISNILKWGVSIASLVMLLGGCIYLARHGMQAPDWQAFHGEPSDLRTIPGTLHEMTSLSGRGIMQLGVLLLIATPLIRVAFSVFAFFMQRDHLYTIVTLMVLGVLAYSLLGVF